MNTLTYGQTIKTVYRMEHAIDRFQWIRGCNRLMMVVATKPTTRPVGMEMIIK